MIDTDGFITVAEAAKRLHRSEEQVRRNLRQGKLRGKRVGNQWFVAEPTEPVIDRSKRPLIPPEMMAEILALRRKIQPLLGDFDLVKAIHEDRESH